MACGCKNRNKSIEKSSSTTESVNKMDDITIEPIEISSSSTNTDSIFKAANYSEENRRRIITNAADNIVSDASVIKEAELIGLKQCYLCTKKHIARAQEFFIEYLTGYPTYIKNLVDSLRAAEVDVNRAFLLWQKTMAQMNMAEGELLGSDFNIVPEKEAHIELAKKIRQERLKLSDDVLYSPDFSMLLTEVHLLQHKVIENG